MYRATMYEEVLEAMHTQHVCVPVSSTPRADHVDLVLVPSLIGDQGKVPGLERGWMASARDTTQHLGPISRVSCSLRLVMYTSHYICT